MISPQLSPEVLQSFEDWKQATSDFNKAVRLEVERLKSLYVGKMAKVKGHAGWNAGRIWHIEVWSTGAGSEQINIYFFIGQTKKRSKMFLTEQVSILEDEETAEYEASKTFHERINNRTPTL